MDAWKFQCKKKKKKLPGPNQSVTNQIEARQGIPSAASGSNLKCVKWVESLK
jgi:hypothetical protein